MSRGKVDQLSNEVGRESKGADWLDAANKEGAIEELELVEVVDDVKDPEVLEVLDELEDCLWHFGLKPKANTQPMPNASSSSPEFPG